MKAQDIKKVVVAGAGTMGSLVAWTFVTHGYEVAICNRSEEGLQRADKLIAQYRETLTDAEKEDTAKRLVMTTDRSVMRDADLVIENIAEVMEVKHTFFREIEPLLKDDCIVATNTSGLPITELAAVLEHPERFCGMHWFNPANLIPLVEIISGDKTSAETSDIMYEISEKIGKKPIRIKDIPGFAVNRLQLALLREAIHITELGAASMEDIDRAVKYALGIRYACIGPFETTDLGGIDVFTHIAEYLYRDLADDKEPQKTLKEHMEQGTLGVKSGSGFYDYSGDKGAAAMKARDEKLAKIGDALYGES